MNAKKRYSSILLSFIFLVLCYYGGRKFRRKTHGSVQNLKSIWDRVDKSEDVKINWLQSEAHSTKDSKTCSMESCFNFSKCEKRPFKVYVYPIDEIVPPSISYMKIIESLLESRYYTSNPDDACLFVLSLDTLDRDSLSQDFVRNMQVRLDRLEHWNNGENHIVFNLYSGTWPDYTESLSFDIGKAVLAKASISHKNYRKGFDISLPLFHKHHPSKGGGAGFVKSLKFPVTNKHFLAFKGKRYVHGIGSDTRNSLHHLHNGADIVMVTTCKHGKNWRDMMDERCEEDNEEYDKWDYENLLANSTFCLVPRGRRLGSFRFLETLQAGCLPVILSNSWQLPFGEVIDWSAATILVDERHLFHVPEILHNIPQPQISKMRQQTQVLWDKYLSSVQKIVDTTLEIMFERIYPHLSHSIEVWNSSPGALLTLDMERFSGNSEVLVPYGFSSSRYLKSENFITRAREESKGMFTAILSVSSFQMTSSSPVFKLIHQLGLCSLTHKVFILWRSETLAPPPISDWYHHAHLSANRSSGSFLEVVRDNASRFLHAVSAPTSAILSLDEDVSLIKDEIEFAFHVWQQFPDRIVGFPPRSHYWDDVSNKWVYTSQNSNKYSMILTSAAFIHVKYALLLSESLPRSISPPSSEDCEHILVNFLVSHVSRLPPVLVTHKKNFKDASKTARNLTEMASKLGEKQSCINSYVAGFGYMPLLESKLRLDPVLYKDPVSNMRKKYRKIELVQ